MGDPGSVPPLVVISCGRAKRPTPAPAGELYTGSYHRMARAAADALTGGAPERIRILSAKYGLLRLEQPVAPYDLTVGEPGCVTLVELVAAAGAQGLTRQREVIALAPHAYAELIAGVWPHTRRPLAGLGIGLQRGAFSAMTATGVLPTR